MEIKPNNIYCGDAYNLIKDIPDKSVSLIYTDIPYEIQSGGGGHSALSKRIIKTNYVDLKDIRNGIDYSILDEFCRILKHIYIYIWCSKSQILPLMKYFVEEKDCLFDILFWGKTNPTPATNNLFLNDVEYCLVFREKGTYFAKGYFLKSKYYISPLNMNDKSDYGHPTCKPLELVKRHIANSTKPNDNVFDPFMGSATTCVAAKELGRQYIGFEIEEKWFKVAQDRLNGINQKGQIDLFSTDYKQLDLFGDNDE